MFSADLGVAREFLEGINEGLGQGFRYGSPLAVVALAAFGFGAPGWILVLIMLVGLTVYAELGSWVDRRLSRNE